MPNPFDEIVPPSGASANPFDEIAPPAAQQLQKGMQVRIPVPSGMFGTTPSGGAWSWKTIDVAPGSKWEYPATLANVPSEFGIETEKGMRGILPAASAAINKANQGFISPQGTTTTTDEYGNTYEVPVGNIGQKAAQFRQQEIQSAPEMNQFLEAMQPTRTGAQITGGLAKLPLMMGRMAMLGGPIGEVLIGGGSRYLDAKASSPNVTDEQALKAAGISMTSTGIMLTVGGKLVEVPAKYAVQFLQKAGQKEFASKLGQMFGEYAGKAGEVLGREAETIPGAFGRGAGEWAAKSTAMATVAHGGEALATSMYDTEKAKKQLTDVNSFIHSFVLMGAGEGLHSIATTGKRISEIRSDSEFSKIVKEGNLGDHLGLDLDPKAEIELLSNWEPKTQRGKSARKARIDALAEEMMNAPKEPSPYDTMAGGGVMGEQIPAPEGSPLAQRGLGNATPVGESGAQMARPNYPEGTELGVTPAIKQPYEALAGNDLIGRLMHIPGEESPLTTEQQPQLGMKETPALGMGGTFTTAGPEGVGIKVKPAEEAYWEMSKGDMLGRQMQPPGEGPTIPQPEPQKPALAGKETPSLGMRGTFTTAGPDGVGVRVEQPENVPAGEVAPNERMGAQFNADLQAAEQNVQTAQEALNNAQKDLARKPKSRKATEALQEAKDAFNAAQDELTRIKGTRPREATWSETQKVWDEIKQRNLTGASDISQLPADAAKLIYAAVKDGFRNAGEWYQDMLKKYGKEFSKQVGGFAGAKKMWDEHYSKAVLKFLTGAPPSVKDIKSRGPLIEKLTSMAREGEASRFWYTDSENAINTVSGNNDLLSLKIASLAALYSRTDGVPANGAHVIRAYEQFMTGEEIRASRYPNATKKAATQIMEAQTSEDVLNVIKGKKINPFMLSLIQRFLPEDVRENLPPVIDVHMMRAAGYDTDNPSVTQTRFMQDAVKEVASKLGWKNEEAQAAIWTPQKAMTDGTDVTVAGFHFGDAFKRIAGPVTYETMPASDVRESIFPGIKKATTEQLSKFNEAKNDLIDRALAAFGVPVAGKSTGHGYWDWESNPVNGVYIPMPAAFGGEKTMMLDSSAKKTVRFASALIGKIMSDKGTIEQEGVGYNRPFYTGSKELHNAVVFKFNRELSADEMIKLGGALEKLGIAYPENSKKDVLKVISPMDDWAWGSVTGAKVKDGELVRTDEGNILVDDIDAARKSAKKFHKNVEQIVRENTPDDITFEAPKSYHSEGQLIRRDQYGQELERGWGGRGGPEGPLDLHGRSVDYWAKENESINDKFREEYGWGQRGGANAIEVTGVHYSPVEGLTELRGDKYGTNAAGREKARIDALPEGDPLKKRSMFYEQTGEELPEKEGVVRGENAYKANLNNVYDLVADPEGLKAKAREYADSQTGHDADYKTATERMILEAGYNAYANEVPGIPGRAIVVMGESVPVERVGGAKPRGEMANMFGLQEMYEAGMNKAKDSLGLERTATDKEVVQAIGEKIGKLGASVRETAIKVMNKVQGIGRELADKIAGYLHEMMAPSEGVVTLERSVKAPEEMPTADELVGMKKADRQKRLYPDEYAAWQEKNQKIRDWIKETFDDPGVRKNLYNSMLDEFKPPVEVKYTTPEAREKVPGFDPKKVAQGIPKAVTEVAKAIPEALQSDQEVSRIHGEMERAGVLQKPYEEGTGVAPEAANSGISATAPDVKRDLFKSEGGKVQKIGKVINDAIRSGHNIWGKVFGANNPVADALLAKYQRAHMAHEYGKFFDDVTKPFKDASPQVEGIMRPLFKQFVTEVDRLNDLERIKPDEHSSPKNADEWQKQVDQVKTNIDSLVEQKNAAIRRLAQDHSDVRIAVAAEMQPDKYPTWLKLSAQEEKAAESIRDFTKKMGESLRKVGIGTLDGDALYVMHMGGRLIDDPASTKFNPGQIRNVLNFRHRGSDVGQWLPSVYAFGEAYVPSVTHKLAFQPFLNKWGSEGGILDRKNNNGLTNRTSKNFAPEAAKYLTEMIDGIQNPLKRDWSDSFIDAQRELTNTMLLGANARVGWKHLVGKATPIAAEHHAFVPVATRSQVEAWLGKQADKHPGFKKVLEAMGLNESGDWDKKAELINHFVVPREIMNTLQDDPFVSDLSRGKVSQKLSPTGRKIMSLASSIYRGIKDNPVRTIESWENGLNAMACLARAKGMDFNEATYALLEKQMDYNFRGGADAPGVIKSKLGRIMVQYAQTPMKSTELKAKLIYHGLKGGEDVFGSNDTSRLIRHAVAYGAVMMAGSKLGVNVADSLGHVGLINQDIFHHLWEMGKSAVKGELDEVEKRVAAIYGINKHEGIIPIAPWLGTNATLLGMIYKGYQGEGFMGKVKGVLGELPAAKQIAPFFGGELPKEYETPIGVVTGTTRPETPKEKDDRQILRGMQELGRLKAKAGG